MKRPLMRKQFSLFRSIFPVGLIAVLLLFCVAVSLAFVHQYVVVLGVASNYLNTEEMIAFTNSVFRYQHDSSYYSSGLIALDRAGYGGFSHYFLMNPMLPFIVIAIILLICVVFVYNWREKRERIAREEDSRRMINWIQSEAVEEIYSPFYSIALVNAIVAQKKRMQKQKEIHNEDTTRIMHYMEDISHQLKTPLTVVRVACERLVIQNSSARAVAETCLSQINKMTILIQDLLQLGRFDCNKQKKNFSHVNAQELLETITNDLEFVASPQKITFELIGSSSTCWFCDSYWIKQAIGNILKNCIEHSSDSQIRIRYESNENTNHITIEDNGCGFPPGYEQQVFQRFSFGSTTKTDSSGLGMAIAQEAIKMHYGSVSAANRPDGGAIFRIVFPRFDANDIYSPQKSTM